MLFATALTLALIGFVAAMLADLTHQNGAKIAAALQGRSSTSAHPALPTKLRFSPRYTVAQREPVRSALRAAA